MNFKFIIIKKFEITKVWPQVLSPSNIDMEEKEVVGVDEKEEIEEIQKRPRVKLDFL